MLATWLLRKRRRTVVPWHQAQQLFFDFGVHDAILSDFGRRIRRGKVNLQRFIHKAS